MIFDFRNLSHKRLQQNLSSSIQIHSLDLKSRENDFTFKYLYAKVTETLNIHNLKTKFQ